MKDRKLAQTIAQVLNTPEIIEVLNAYADHNIEFYRQQLEKETNLHEIGFLQGRIKELRELKRLRETAFAVLGA